MNLIRQLYKKITKEKNIHKSAIFWGNKKKIVLSKDSKIWEYVIIRVTGEGILEVGENSRIGPFSVLFTGKFGIKIGKNVMIAPHCVIAAGNHNYKDLNKPMVLAGSLSKGPIIIGDDVWIGANSTITDGVRIGNGVVISANSYVNKDVNDFDIVGGNPIKVIKNRLIYRNKN